MTDSSREAASFPFSHPLPVYVDWLVGVVIALGGMGLMVGGSALTFVVDRALLEESVESGQFTVMILERDLTETQMLEFTQEIVNWTGLGLLVTGIGLVLFAGGYVGMRYRARRGATTEGEVVSYRAHAVIGGVATVVLSFLPFSPIIGGGIAGYLEHQVTGKSIGVGGLAGFLSMIPVISILTFVTIGLFAGFFSIHETGLGIVMTLIMFLVLLFVAAYGAGLGALGGFVASRLVDANS